MRTTITKIISGGQTGVDRAALDFAIEAGYEQGGSCPQGRRAEDGRIPDKYNLVELSSPSYRDRTARNIMDADLTLVLHRGVLTPGTSDTCRLAEHVLSKPWLEVNMQNNVHLEGLRTLLQGVRTLNVAGPRESKMPGIHEETMSFLYFLLGPRRVT